MLQEDRQPEHPGSGPDGDESIYDLAPEDSADSAAPSEPSRSTTGSSERRCQNCGAPMPEDDAVMVCPSCGYDIVTNRVVDRTETVEQPVETTVDDSISLVGSPLVSATAWRPLAIAAGVVLAAVAFAMLAGWSSFFIQRDGNFLDGQGRAVLDSPATSARFGAVLRLLIGSTVIVACGAAAIRAAAWFESRTFGEPRAVLARLSLAVAAAAAVRLIPIESHVLRNIVHGGLGIAVIALVMMLVLRDRGRLLGIVLVSWAVAFLLVVPVARLIAWSIPIF
jgi:predicted RNA-binding Zn-ribbon protein involved in translation (DUF1610 family)